jgi:hypothetical protein
MNTCLEQESCQRPHLVILGAGASLAAFPNGDKNGKRLPLLQNLVDVVGLGELLLTNDVPYEGKNFEEIYSSLYGNLHNQILLNKIEEKIEEYFNSLKIPDEPTLYDHLVLSLRKKDRIATFNWDPLLWQAATRCSLFTEDIPNLFFLHGNLAIAIDHNKKLKVPVGHLDSNQTNLHRCKLLYPIKTKKYTSDKFIKNEWELLQFYLKKAYRLTIFGYSAPTTDVEAISLLKDGWGNGKEIEETDIIDLKTEDVLYDTWKDFICGDHWGAYQSFYKTDLALFPRRSCEKLWQETQGVKFLDYPEQSPLIGKNFDELKEYIGSLG